MRAASHAILILALLLAGCASAPGPAGGADEPSEQGAGDCLALLAGVDLQHASIADLQAALDAGTITSVELVDAYVLRIATFDALDAAEGPRLNSVQAVSPTARAQAAALDAERASGIVRGPLHGIPILLKDNIAAHDQPTTAGSIALAENWPDEEATLTAKLRDAGAIILGKAHLSEFANWVSLTMPNGYSSLGGQVVNAYTGGDPSGSSAGSGVAGSMALAAATLGTETSGSILSPSNANSLVGVKPTLGLVSRAGVIPLAASFDTPGPMTRNVVDAAAVLGAIAGPDPADPATAASAAQLPPGGDYTAALSTSALQGVRLGYAQSDNALFADARAALEAAGAELVLIDPKDADSVSILEIGLIFNEFKFGINQYLATTAGPDVAVNDLTEIILFNQDHPDEVKYGQDLLIASDSSAGLGPLADATALPVITANRAVADDLFASNDVDAIIGPDAPFTGLGAAAGYPTIVVPSGYNDDEPQGLSFFGPAWSEARLLSYAYAYEQATHLRQPPTTINPSLVSGLQLSCGALGEP